MIESPFHLTRKVIEEGIAAGLHPGAQLYVSVGGRTVADLAFGEARAGVAMTVDSLNLWMSSTKPVAAVAIAQLQERGLLNFEDRVTRFLPEFGVNGKEPITIRHILTHTAGFRSPPKSQEVPWEQIISEVCAMRIEPGWAPGQKTGYHPASSWYVLGEIVRRIDGRFYSQYVRDEIFLPLGMRDSWIGMPAERFEKYGDRIAPMHTVTKDGQIVPLNPRTIALDCRPGSSGWGPIRELGKFYEMLLKRDGVIRPASVALLTSRQRIGMFDETFKHVIDWGLGFLINSTDVKADLPYGYGPVASPETFGHGGAGSSGAFCDPGRQLVVAYVFNAQPGEDRHHARREELLKAVYEDLKCQ